MSERFIVEVSYNSRVGYVASRPDLPAISALSLSMLRRRIEERLIGEDVDIRLVLDKRARFERDQRRKGGVVTRQQLWPRGERGLGQDVRYQGANRKTFARSEPYRS